MPPDVRKRKKPSGEHFLSSRRPAKSQVTEALQNWATCLRLDFFCTKNVIHLLPLRWAHFGSGDCPIFYFPALDEEPDQCPPSHWEILGTLCSWGRQMPLGLHMDSLGTWTAPAFGCLPPGGSTLYPEPPGSQFEPLSIRGLIFNGFHSMVDKSVRERQGTGNA